MKGKRYDLAIAEELRMRWFDYMCETPYATQLICFRWTQCRAINSRRICTLLRRTDGIGVFFVFFCWCNLLTPMNYYGVLFFFLATATAFVETESSVTANVSIPYERPHTAAPEFCWPTNCRNKFLFALILSSLKSCLSRRSKPPPHREFVRV